LFLCERSTPSATGTNASIITANAAYGHVGATSSANAQSLNENSQSEASWTDTLVVNGPNSLVGKTGYMFAAFFFEASFADSVVNPLDAYYRAGLSATSVWAFSMIVGSYMDTPPTEVF
jgi:hypothetical protein